MQIKVFNCPLHGIEINAYCWRAYQKENKDRWGVYNLFFNRSITNEEFEEIRANFVYGDKK